ICGVPAGFALCIFQRNCGACAFTSTEATVVAAAAMPAPLMNSRRFMASSLVSYRQLSRAEHHVRHDQNDLWEEIEDQDREPLQPHEGQHSLVDVRQLPFRH